MEELELRLDRDMVKGLGYGVSTGAVWREEGSLERYRNDADGDLQTYRLYHAACEHMAR